MNEIKIKFSQLYPDVMYPYSIEFRIQYGAEGPNSALHNFVDGQQLLRAKILDAKAWLNTTQFDWQVDETSYSRVQFVFKQPQEAALFKLAMSC